MRGLVRGFAAGALCAGFAGAAVAQVDVPVTPQDWSFQHAMGGFDIAAAQRGLAVYQAACASCHGISHLAYGDLSGLGLNANQLHAFAASSLVPGGEDADGHLVFRPAQPGDRFAAPYRNDAAARAANAGVLPPDMSRATVVQPHGADKLYGLLTGYVPPPPDLTLGQGMAYNLHVAGNVIAMPNPFENVHVAYADGVKATPEQMARDVTTFLAWASEPHLVQRRQMGVKIVLFLVLLIVLVSVVRRRGVPA
jgi:ubiquinol-cytochrome c reductase cytochrome c1 subunit